LALITYTTYQILSHLRIDLPKWSWCCKELNTKTIN